MSNGPKTGVRKLSESGQQDRVVRVPVWMGVEREGHSMAEFEQISQHFVLQRMRVHAQFYLSNYPMLRNTCTVQETMQYFDRDMQRCFMLLADMAKGETREESRTVKEIVEFNIFASWWDHLKFRLKEGRLAWLPLGIKRRISIRYQKVAKTVELSVPVKVTRACPHVTADWQDRMDLHVAFLKPLEWAKSGPTPSSPESPEAGTGS